LSRLIKSCWNGGKELRNIQFEHSAEQMAELPDDSVALMVTSPPYHVGKDYDSDASFEGWCPRPLDDGG
jgi:DNA modification methylase